MQEVIITGNIGKDAEVIQTRDGRGVLTFSVAVKEGKEELLRGMTYLSMATTIRWPPTLSRVLEC